MTRFFLIRHGQSEANLTNVYVGQTDVPLTHHGILQAERTALWLAENYHVDAVYASDLQRAYCTGQALAKLLSLPVIAVPEMREINAGKWENITIEELKSRFFQSYNVWLTDIGHAVCPGGETVAELMVRVVEAVKRLGRENEGKTIAIATHATPLRALQCYCENKTLDEMKDISWVPNASVTTVVYDHGELKITEIGFDLHLGELRTALPTNV